MEFLQFKMRQGISALVGQPQNVFCAQYEIAQDAHPGEASDQAYFSSVVAIRCRRLQIKQPCNITVTGICHFYADGIFLCRCGIPALYNI